MDQVGRLGLNWYTRSNQGLFDLATPRYKPMGFNKIPDFIKSITKKRNIYSSSNIQALLPFELNIY